MLFQPLDLSINLAVAFSQIPMVSDEFAAVSTVSGTPRMHVGIILMEVV